MIGGLGATEANLLKSELHQLVSFQVIILITNLLVKERGAACLHFRIDCSLNRPTLGWRRYSILPLGPTCWYFSVYINVIDTGPPHGNQSYW